MSSAGPSSARLNTGSSSTQDIVIIPNESCFHEEYYKLGRSLRERDPARRLARFLRDHHQINDFVRGLENSTGLSNHRLRSAFWTKAFEVIKVRCHVTTRDRHRHSNTLQQVLTTQRFGPRDTLITECLSKLSTVVPAFGPDLPLFPENETVQKPLREIFLTYMECYEMLIARLGPQQDAGRYSSSSASSHWLMVSKVDFRDFSAQTEWATRRVAALKQEWRELVEQEVNNQAARAAAAARELDRTRSSYYITSTGPYRPGNINVSFEKLELLGRGTFGEVHKVRELSTGTMYAQKAVRATEPRSRQQLEKTFRNEVAIMQSLRHHHIASVQFPLIEDSSYSFIMLPIADCDLAAFMRNFAVESFPGTELMHLTGWFGCLVSALAFAHSKSIKHEDIKPSNILIKNHQPYLTDFGCAKDFSSLDSSTSESFATTGTPVYWPPEKPPRGRKADVFSLGCVFSEMLTVRHKRTIDEYRQYRRAGPRTNSYAFRENLDGVAAWLTEIVPPKDSVGSLLKEQTMLMLEPKPDRRRQAGDIKKGLRFEGEMVFCSSCN